MYKYIMCILISYVLATCSSQNLVHAWWQIDLQGLYTIHGIDIYREPGKLGILLHVIYLKWLVLCACMQTEAM